MPSTPEQASHSSLKRYGGIVITLIVITLIAFGADWAFRVYVPEQIASAFADPDEYVNALNEYITTQSIPRALADELAGSHIYFMMANKGSAYTRPHVFENGSFSAAPLEGAQADYVSTSADGSKMTFFAVPPERQNMGTGWHVRAQAYVYDQNTLHGESYPSAQLDQGIVVSSEGISLKKLLSVSNNGAVLFSGWDKETLPGIEPASNWSIYYSSGTHATSITSGFMPKWLNDREFLFLRTDGIYVRNIDTKEERQLTTPTDAIYSNNAIDVSDDGKTLVWTRPNEAQIVIYNIASDTSLTERGTIATRGFFPVISPSGAFLAVRTAQTEMDPKIEFFDLSSLTHVDEFSIPLNDFEPLYVLMTDWATNN